MKVLVSTLLTLTCFLCNATDNNADQLSEAEKKDIQIIKKLTTKNVRMQQKEKTILFKVIWTQKER